MLIKLTPEDAAKCYEFASKIDTGFYATRGQLNNTKRIRDQFCGKIGELAAYRYFQSKGIELSQPDFEIYGRNKKSWDYDMKGDGINLHCKSQLVEQGNRYGISYIFENTDKHIFKEYSANDYVCFVSVNLEKKEAEIRAVVKLQDLHDKKLFALPKLAYLRTKAAVYYDDLKKSLKDNLFAK